jgi:hypothetical protein
MSKLPVDVRHSILADIAGTIGSDCVWERKDGVWVIELPYSTPSADFEDAVAQIAQAWGNDDRLTILHESRLRSLYVMFL